jgi:hypothetical protein
MDADCPWVWDSLRGVQERGGRADEAEWDAMAQREGGFAAALTGGVPQRAVGGPLAAW